MNRLQRYLAAITTAAACSISAAPAIAQGLQSAATSADSADRARALYKQAESAFGDGNVARARTLLLEAWSLNPSYDVAAALGQAELQLKMYRDAAEHFDFALKHAAPTSSPEGIEAVKRDLRNAKADVSELQITVNEATATIFVDGKEAGLAPLSVFVEPGEHVVEARLGERVVKKSGTFQRGATHGVSLIVPASGDGQAQLPTSGLGTEPQRDKAPNYAPPVVTAVAGGVLLFTGVAFVVVASSKDSKKDELLGELSGKSGARCGSGTPASDKCGEIADLSDSAVTFRALGIGSIVAAAATGVATYLLWPDAKTSTKSAFVVLPSYSVENRLLGIGATGRF